MDKIILETARTRLRTFGERDWPEYAKHLNSAEVRENLGGVEDEATFTRKMRENEANQEQRGFAFWLAEDKITGDLIGTCGFKLSGDTLAEFTDVMEIGWSMRADKWRMGYGYETAQACLNWAFETHKPEHIISVTSERNIGSWRIMEKMGMTRRKDLDYNDPEYPPEDNPTIVYVMTCEKWQDIQ